MGNFKQHFAEARDDRTLQTKEQHCLILRV